MLLACPVYNCKFVTGTSIELLRVLNAICPACSHPYTMLPESPGVSEKARLASARCETPGCSNNYGHYSCSICLEPTNGGDISTTICAHRFHTKCLMPWLRAQDTCPTCRASLISPPGAASASRALPPQQYAEAPTREVFHKVAGPNYVASNKGGLTGGRFLHPLRAYHVLEAIPMEQDAVARAVCAAGRFGSVTVQHPKCMMFAILPIPANAAHPQIPRAHSHAGAFDQVNFMAGIHAIAKANEACARAVQAYFDAQCGAELERDFGPLARQKLVPRTLQVEQHYLPGHALLPDCWADADAMVLHRRIVASATWSRRLIALSRAYEAFPRALASAIGELQTCVSTATWGDMCGKTAYGAQPPPATSHIAFNRDVIKINLTGVSCPNSARSVQVPLDPTLASMDTLVIPGDMAMAVLQVEPILPHALSNALARIARGAEHPHGAIAIQLPAHTAEVAGKMFWLSALTGANLQRFLVRMRSYYADYAATAGTNRRRDADSNGGGSSSSSYCPFYVLWRPSVTGDRVVAYRNPSLSADSMFVLRLHVLPGVAACGGDLRRTIKWNVQIQAAMAGPQNGDFDGDCIMLQFILPMQAGGATFDYLPMAELALMTPATCMETTGLALGVIHDGIVACARLSRWDRFPDETGAFECGGDHVLRATVDMLCEAALHGPHADAPVRRIATPARASGVPTPLAREHVGRYVLSHCFPDELDFSDGTLKICAGVLQAGILGKEHVGPGGSLLRHIVRQFGGDCAVRLVECIHVLAIALQKVFPLTFGRDCYEAGTEARASATRDKHDAERAMAQALLGNALGETSGANRSVETARAIEAGMGGVLGRLTERLSHPDGGMLSTRSNNAYADILAAKSSKSHAAQAILGNGLQQLGPGIANARCPIMGWPHRPLPCSLRPRDVVALRARPAEAELSRANVLSILEARGYVSQSFHEGLSLASAAICAINGRQSLLDTALLTGEIGGLEKSLHTLMNGIFVHHGGALVVIGGMQDVYTGLASFSGGNWCTAAVTLERVAMSTKQLREQFWGQWIHTQEPEVEVVVGERVALPFSPANIAFAVRERAARLQLPPPPPPPHHQVEGILMFSDVLESVDCACARMRTATCDMTHPGKARHIMLQEWLPLTRETIPLSLWRRAFQDTVMRTLERSFISAGFAQGVDSVCRLVKNLQQAALNTFHHTQGSDASTAVMSGATALKSCFGVPEKPSLQRLSVLLSERFWHTFVQKLGIPMPVICRALEAYLLTPAPERAADSGAGLGCFFKPLAHLADKRGKGCVRISVARGTPAATGGGGGGPPELLLLCTRPRGSSARLPRLGHVARILAPFVQRHTWWTDNVSDMQDTMGLFMAERLFRRRLEAFNTGIPPADVEAFARAMFVTGRCAPASRYGFAERKLTQGFMTQMISSQPQTRILQAALNGETDSGRCLASCAVVGTALVPGGTGFAGVQLIWPTREEDAHHHHGDAKLTVAKCRVVEEGGGAVDEDRAGIVWVAQRARHDRHIPNSLRTIAATIDAVQEGATLPLLCARICQALPAIGARVRELLQTPPKTVAATVTVVGTKKSGGGATAKGRKRPASVAMVE
jgi:hypothetical protein